MAHKHKREKTRNTTMRLSQASFATLDTLRKIKGLRSYAEAVNYLAHYWLDHARITPPPCKHHIYSLVFQGLPKILDYMKRLASEFHDDCSELPIRGDSPFGNDIPEGLWSWDEAEQQCIVGTCTDDFRIVSYEEARELLG